MSARSGHIFCKARCYRGKLIILTIAFILKSEYNHGILEFVLGRCYLWVQLTEVILEVVNR